MKKKQLPPLPDVTFLGCLCELTMAPYAHGGLAIQLCVKETGEPMATATVWLPGLRQDHVAIKDYSENEGMLQTLISAGVITEPITKTQSGFVSIPICNLTKKYKPYLQILKENEPA